MNCLHDLQTPDDAILRIVQAENNRNGAQSNSAFSSAMISNLPPIFAPLLRPYQNDFLARFPTSNVAEAAAQKVAAEALRQALSNQSVQGQIPVSNPSMIANGMGFNANPSATPSMSESTTVVPTDKSPSPSPPPPQSKPPKEPTGSPQRVQDDEVDRTKVEAAFNSKPQPGKRRDELNLPERIELARTRNREHARIARQRKKARFEELLDRESKLLQLNKAEELKAERTKTVEKFLSLRTKMLSERQLTLSSAIYENMNTPNANLVALLDELGDTTSGFSFDILTIGTPPTSHETASLTKMTDWDIDFLQRLNSNKDEKTSSKEDDKDTTTTFEYSIMGGKTGIALSSGDNGFARFELQQKVKQGSGSSSSSTTTVKTSTLVLGLLEICFKAESSSLSSVQLTILSDTTTTAN